MEHCLLSAAAAANSLQSCLILCNPIDGGPLGSPVPGILQARTLEWVAISFSNAWKWKVKVKSLSRVWLLVNPWTAAHQAPPSLGFSRQEHWSGWPFPSAMHESEKWKWSLSVVSDPQRPHGLQPSRLLLPWDFPGKSTGVGCHCLLCKWIVTSPQLKSTFLTWRMFFTYTQPSILAILIWVIGILVKQSIWQLLILFTYF